MSVYSLHLSDPGVTDDRSNGFFRGHRWINTRQDRELVCIDHTIGAAVWEATAQHHVTDHMFFTGVANWRESGKYWGVGGGTFYLKRGGEGYVNGERVIWAKSQSIALTANACNFIRVDADGAISKATSWSSADFRNYINLFEVWYVSDSEYIVCKEDHLVRFPSDTSVHLHELLGTLFIEPTGAQMTRVSTGSGAAAGDREIKIVNVDVLEDHGLETDIPDSGGAGVVWEWLYTDGSGHWRRDAQQTEAVMKWNDGGTPTALGANKYGVWRFAATKDNKNTTDPVYLAAMGDAEYNNLTAARNAIAAGVPDFTNEIELLEIARLGYCIVQNSGGGYIVEIIIEKDILAGNTTGAGATNVAALVSTNVDNFDGILSATDANVQSALETIDELTVAPGVSQARKSADETVNNDQSTNVDADLQLAVVADQAYFIEGVLKFDSTTNAGCRVKLSGPAVNYAALSMELRLSSVFYGGTHGTSFGITANQNTVGDCMCVVRGFFEPSANGTVTFDWAQKIAHADNTILKEGSYIRVTKLPQ